MRRTTIGLALAIGLPVAAMAGSSATTTTTTSAPALLTYATARLAEVQPCGCTPQRGGLARQAAYLMARRGTASVGLVEAGDTFFKNWRVNPSESPQLVHRARTIAKVLGEQGLLATALGECDLAIGLPVLESIAASAAFPILCANAVAQDGRRPFPAMLRTKIGMMDVVLIGAISESFAKPLAAHGLKVGPPADEVQKVLAGLEPRPARTVLLGHLSEDEAGELVERVKGLDVVILGHTGCRTAQPRRVGATLIVGADQGGRELGEIDLAALPKSGVLAHQHVPLGDKILEDPNTAAQVSALEARKLTASPNLERVADEMRSEMMKKAAPVPLQELMGRGVTGGALGRRN